MGVFYVKPTFLPIWDTRHPPKSSPASSPAVRTVSVHDFWLTSSEAEALQV